MKQYDFDTDSHFFAEMLTFPIPCVGLIRVIRFPESKAINIDRNAPAFTVK